MSVRAFQPRKIGPPQFVAEDLEELSEKLGEYVSAEQCDGCGNPCYRIERRNDPLLKLPDGHYLAVCAVDPDEPDEFKHTAPCGSRYAITVWDDEQVVF
jgi:hypothetical protein